MEYKFTDWYTQALGATLGILACIYSYMNGDMIIYSNLDTFFDTLGFGAIVSSYLLLPFCIIILLLAIITSFSKSKSFFNISLKGFNSAMIILTVIVGFLGANIYFIIPTIFLAFNLRHYVVLRDKSTTQEEDTTNAEFIEQDFSSDKTIIFKENNDSYSTLGEPIDTDTGNLATKLEMAKELLLKNAQKQFITELTGLTLKEIESLEKQIANNG